MFCRAAAIGVALAVLGTAAPARGDDRVRSRDHVQLHIDYLELKDASAPIKISVRVDGKTAWTRRLAAAPVHAGLGPVVGPPGAKFNVTVSRTDGAAPVVVAALTLTDKGKDSSKSFDKGEVKKVIVSTRGVDVWALPELQVAVLSRLDARRKKLVQSALLALNKRIVDVTDGHVRIDRFVVYGAPIPDGVAADVSVGRCDGDCPRATGRPKQMAAFRVADASADALTRAFARAYLGVPGERDCFGRGDDDGEFDCRGAVATALREDLGISLGSSTLDGPPPHRLPEVTFAADTIDFGADAADSEPPEGKTIGDVVSRYADELGKCLAAADTASVSIKLSVRGADGRLMWVRVDGKSKGDLADCVSGVLKDARFPRSKSSRTVVEFGMSQ